MVAFTGDGPQHAQDVRRTEPSLNAAGDDVVQVGAAGTLTEHRTEVGQAEDAGRDVRRTALRLADDERLTGVDDHTGAGRRSPEWKRLPVLTWDSPSIGGWGEGWNLALGGYSVPES